MLVAEAMVRMLDVRVDNGVLKADFEIWPCHLVRVRVLMQWRTFNEDGLELVG